MTTTLSFATVDVFTPTRFTGNPLAIVNIRKEIPLSQQTKQKIAREFNLSETVFLHEDDGSGKGRRFDIFTINEELPFAERARRKMWLTSQGHPTIGTLYWIGSQSNVQGQNIQNIKLLCKAGLIDAKYDHDTNIAMAKIPHDVHIHNTGVSLEAVLKSQPRLEDNLYVENEFSGYPIVSPVKGMQFVLIRLKDLKRSLPRIQLSHVPVHQMEAGAGFVAPYFYVMYDHETKPGWTRIESRMVEPEIGEDPATGSAACALTCYLALQHKLPGKKFTYDIKQGADMGRESHIGVEVTIDATGGVIEKVVLSGTAVVVSQGTMTV
ncbi:hypothetical protein MMC26_002200 [Xylographa opegraphella]|nr:hypothetical protein [Xylographa opegraphella]